MVLVIKAASSMKHVVVVGGGFTGLITPAIKTTKLSHKGLLGD